ncbi:MAG: hypothetical protein PHS49_06405 [Candidatus Gracilibacteria bacterium]|nr:hypothetical protein [Candidatus Gracilibacteria bacterium]
MKIFPYTHAEQGCCSWHKGVCFNKCCDGTNLSIECGGEQNYILEIMILSIFIILILNYLVKVIKNKIKTFTSIIYKNKSLNLYNENKFENALYYIELSLKYNINIENLRIKGLILYKLNKEKEADLIFKSIIYK